VNQILPGTARKTLALGIPFLLSGGVMALGIALLQGPIMNTFGGVSVAALIVVVIWGALLYVAATVVLQRALVLEVIEVLIKALGIDRRWPKLVPHRLRPSK